MSIFSKKKEVSLEDFCRDFYEKTILNPVIQGIDAGAIYFETVRKNAVEADQRFSHITSEQFATLMIPMWFELFALAWLHRFGEKSSIALSAFTQRFLREKKREDIWDASEVYNRAIARSSTILESYGSTPDYAYLARVDKTRMDLFGEHFKEGDDPEYVARPVNRLFCEKAWKRGITAGLLMLALCSRLGFDENFEPNKEAEFRLTSIIRMLYDGASQSLNKIKISE